MKTIIEHNRIEHDRKMETIIEQNRMLQKNVDNNMAEQKIIEKWRQ